MRRPLRLALKLRVPGWCEGATLKVNGEKQNVAANPATYLELRRTWKAGDRVELKMPMPAQLIEAHPLVEETRNEVAVKRGPVVYCLESNDLPEGVRISDVRVPRDIELKPRFASKLLQGVAVVEGKASARSEGDWGGKLYRPLDKERSTPFSARFIPYYAWSNRGESEMSVWLPLE